MAASGEFLEAQALLALLCEMMGVAGEVRIYAGELPRDADAQLVAGNALLDVIPISAASSTSFTMHERATFFRVFSGDGRVVLQGDVEEAGVIDALRERVQ